MCLKRFHTRQRVFKHLRLRDNVCVRALLRFEPLLTEIEADEMDRLETERLKEVKRKGGEKPKERRYYGQLPGPFELWHEDPTEGGQQQAKQRAELLHWPAAQPRSTQQDDVRDAELHDYQYHMYKEAKVECEKCHEDTPLKMRLLFQLA